jgi:hypothetical protein
MILLDDLGIWVVGLGEAERIDADADAALDDIKLPCISMIPSFPLYISPDSRQHERCYHLGLG